MNAKALRLRYRFLRHHGWNPHDARTAVAILAGKFLGHFAK